MDVYPVFVLSCVYAAALLQAGYTDRFTHNSEQQVITAPSLTSTLYKPHTKSSPARSVLNSRFLVTDVNSGDSSASCAQVLPVRLISNN
jgi:hypothetical protein